MTSLNQRTCRIFFSNLDILFEIFLNSLSPNWIAVQRGEHELTTCVNDLLLNKSFTKLRKTNKAAHSLFVHLGELHLQVVRDVLDRSKKNRQL